MSHFAECSACHSHNLCLYVEDIHKSYPEAVQREYEERGCPSWDNICTDCLDETEADLEKWHEAAESANNKRVAGPKIRMVERAESSRTHIKMNISGEKLSEFFSDLHAALLSENIADAHSYQDAVTGENVLDVPGNNARKEVLGPYGEAEIAIIGDTSDFFDRWMPANGYDPNGEYSDSKWNALSRSYDREARAKGKALASALKSKLDTKWSGYTISVGPHVDDMTMGLFLKIPAFRE